ncbi:MAG: DUF4974 domain-containing protein [Cyclobacteriaceae bacterium]|nr:DUF4974 domain-containing protein [Cyclobacteriaceae bacterium]
MKEETAKIWELFIKQKGGKISVDEERDLLSWKQNHREEFDEFTSIYHMTEEERNLPAFEAAQDWPFVHTLTQNQSQSRSGAVIRIFPWLARIAAAIILVIGITYIFNHKTSSSSDDLALYAMLATDADSQKSITLPDGTLVTLNKKSELLYPEYFDGSTRSVYLKGEAFFDVKKNTEKPFVIYSGNTKTSVLGTKFNLRAYSDEHEIRLTVLSGRVAFALADDKEKVIVEPGGMAVLSGSFGAIRQGLNADANFLSWKTKKLSFNQEKLPALIDALQRHYGVLISIDDDASKQCTFTGDFEETSLENALRIVAMATGTNIEHREGRYIIMGNGCN